MNTKEEIKLKAEIEKELRDLREMEYPILKVLRRFGEIMDDFILSEKRRFSSRPQPTRRGPQPTGRTGQQRPYSVKIVE